MDVLVAIELAGGDRRGANGLPAAMKRAAKGILLLRRRRDIELVNPGQ